MSLIGLTQQQFTGTNNMNNTEYLKLIGRWQAQGCYQSRNKIVVGVINLVYQIANRFKTSNSQDDLFSEGILGVMKACDTFSSENGSGFLTYARTCIRNNMLDYLRTDHVIPKGSRSMHHSNLSYHPIPSSHSEVQELALLTNVSYQAAQKYAMMARGDSFDEVSDLITSDTTYEAVLMLERYEQLTKGLQKVKVREYDMLNRYYIEERTFRELGDEYDISSQRAQQMIKSVIRKLGVTL